MNAVVETTRPKTLPPGLPPGGPTFDGFKWFVTNMMAVPTDAMPDDAQLQIAFDEALNLAYIGLASIPSQPTTPSIYAFAVYNLGCHLLTEFALDTPPSTFWSDLRNKLGLNVFTPGLINQAHDQGTGEGMYILPQLQGMTLFNLQLTKSPWCLKYLMIAGQWGYIWDITI